MTSDGGLMVIDAGAVSRLLTYEVCIPVVAAAMRALSSGVTRQLPRTIIPLAGGDAFGLMPGALAPDGYFGAKLIGVMADPDRPGRSRHRGVVALFEPGSGRPVCVADAEEITRIRTAAASAAATDVLTAPGAARLAILGCGVQAIAHAEAIAAIRPLAEIRIWGRSLERATAAAAALKAKLGVAAQPFDDVRAAIADAEIICTTTAARDPILFGETVPDGAHVNLVGSSAAHAAEADSELVRRSRFFVESRESLDKYGELQRASAAGLIGDNHVAGEIGEVMLGIRPGRTSASDVTVYKSVGHAVQDLAAAAYLFERLRGEGDDTWRT
jgi:ornithine cyclodeaminase